MSKNGIILRDYQRETMESIKRLAEAGVRRPMVVWATGLGKGTLLAELCRWWPGKVMAIAEREMLVAKMAEEFESYLGERVCCDYADICGLPARVTISSVQSLSQQRGGRYHRLERYSMHDHDWLLLVDECHHTAAATYRSICGYFRTNPRNMLVGVTATPDRHDRLSLVGPQRIFDPVDYSAHPWLNLTLPWGIDNGWLVPLKYFAVQVDEITEYVRAHPRWKEHELNKEIAESDEMAIKFASTLTGNTAGVGDIVGNRQTVVFTSDVTMAKKVAAAINTTRPGAADVVSSWAEHSPHNDAVMAAFRAGDIQFLVNSKKVTEGVDVPNVACVADLAPTKSRATKTQRIGRGTRTVTGTVSSDMTPAERRAAIAASSKPYCLCLDFVGNSPEMVHAPDVLIPTMAGFGSLPKRVRKEVEDEVKEYVRRRVEAGETPSQGDLLNAESDVLAMVEMRDAAHALRREREAYKQFALTRGSASEQDYRRLGSSDAPVSQFEPKDHKPLATDKQVKTLETYGWKRDRAQKLERKQAGAIITEHMMRGTVKVPTSKMRRLLKALALWKDGLTLREAHDRLNMAQSQGLTPDWSRLKKEDD